MAEVDAPEPAATPPAFVVVPYCGSCSLPLEYCKEYSPSKEACAKWAEQNVDATTGALKNLSLAEKKEAGGAAPAAGKKKAAAKKKNAGEPEVVLKRVARSKRKFVTEISGPDLFGVKMNECAKAMGKKFACGASVTKGVQDKPDMIEVQGDVTDAAAQMLVDKFAIPVSAIYYIDESKKKEKWTP